MNADAFRAIALSLPDTAEVGHLQHPDFRRAGKIFATLGYPDEAWGMVKLTPEEQAVVVAAEPAVFTPANGAWGRGGSTLVRLSAASEPVVAPVMNLAWENAAPKARPARPRATRRAKS